MSVTFPASTTYNYRYPAELNPNAIGNLNVYEIDDFATGVLTASQVIVRRALNRAITLPANLAGSQITAGTAATAAAAFLVQRTPAGSTTPATIATLTIAAGGTTIGTYSTQAAVTCAVGDTITVVAPATADTTLASVAVNLLANLFV